MRSLRWCLLSLLILAVTAALAGPSSARAQDDFERCKAIAADQERLDCLKKLLPGPQGAPSTANIAQDHWPLLRTPRPNGAADAVAIMRTADTTQSDPDLAGLMIRCTEGQKLEVLLALVRPLPPRSKHDVNVNLGASAVTLHGEALPVGTALALPIEATMFTTGPWRDLKQLAVRVNDPEGDIRGVIALDGVGPAMTKLLASCPAN